MRLVVKNTFFNRLCVPSRLRPGELNITMIYLHIESPSEYICCKCCQNMFILHLGFGYYPSEGQLSTNKETETHYKK